MSYQFKSDWTWIQPSDLSNDILRKIAEEVLKKNAGDGIEILSNAKTWWDIAINYKIAKPIVNFAFVPSSESTPTIQNGIIVPVFVGYIKQDANNRYLMWKTVGIGASMAGLAAGSNMLSWEDALYIEAIGVGSDLNAAIAHKQADDPDLDYTQIVEPTPYDIHEINNSLPEGLKKMAIQESFNALSYGRAEAISYARYSAAINDSAYQYAVLQLDAARKYNDKYIERIGVLNDIYRPIIQNNKPLNDEEINNFKNQISTKGLSPQIKNVLSREITEDDISNFTQLILNINNELYKNSSLIIDYDIELAKSKSNTSIEYLNEIIDINTNQLGQPVIEANSSEIEELENYKNYIKTDLDKGYKTEELKQNILLMLDAADKLIIKTNNDKYLNYYIFASISLTEYVVLADDIPPTTNLTLSGTLGNNGWYISDVQVNLTATDNVGGSGVNNTKYSFDNATWNTYNAPFNITNEGTTTLYYHSTDNAGNVEPTKNQTIKIDKTPPEADIRFNVTSKDIKVYNNEIGSEASYKVLPTKKGKDGKEVPDDDGKTGYELRQYTLKDPANNSLLLVLEYIKGKPGIMVKILTTQYNGGTAIAAPK